MLAERAKDMVVPGLGGVASVEGQHEQVKGHDGSVVFALHARRCGVGLTTMRWEFGCEVATRVWAWSGKNATWFIFCEQNCLLAKGTKT